MAGSDPQGSRETAAMPTTHSEQPAVNGVAGGNPAIKPKKSKNKKSMDPSETGKLLAAKINQLELDAAGEKDLEQEIEREVRKATRDLNNLLVGMGTPMERMEALQKKNQDLFADMKRLEREHAKSKKRADQMQKERDLQRSELNKATSLKEKLEKLAREFTKENKKLKEDIKRLEVREKKSREVMGDTTEMLLSDIDKVMSRRQKPEVSSTSREVEELFRQKFKGFFDQYNLRELHFLSLIRAKECEIQHNLARYESQRRVAETEAAKSKQLSSQVSTFSQTETELRSQLNIYVEKFKQVEDTLNNSNDLFLTFRKEMEDMSKKTKRLEKENLSLTRKHELTNRNIIEMAEERTRTNTELEALRKKNSTLESVIRRMQDQGRAPAMDNALEDEDGTESDYDSEDEDGEYYVGSEEAEYDEDTEEDVGTHASTAPAAVYGPLPPNSSSTTENGRNGALQNGLAEK